MARSALITGITGQDGHYLAELLDGHGYEVAGIVRDANQEAARDLRGLASLVTGDMRDRRFIHDAIERFQPDEIYNLAAISSLEEADADPEGTALVNGRVPSVILDVIAGSEIRFCQASSSQIFGPPDGTPRDETTPVAPANPYAVAKAQAQVAVREAREEGTFAASAILFNHESPRRTPRFVSRRITMAVASIAAGNARELRLWNLASSRDWGFAGDYARAMWMMLQHDEPDDYVIATGRLHTVEEFVRLAFSAIGITGWEPFVVIEGGDAEIGSPGAPVKAERTLGWNREVSFEELVRLMVEHDVALAEKGGLPPLHS